MKIISSYDGPSIPPESGEGDRRIQDHPHPLYPLVLLTQKLQDYQVRDVVISMETEYRIIENLKSLGHKVYNIDELKEKYDTDSVSGVITELMRRNFCHQNIAYYVNSSWCTYWVTETTPMWAASDAYIFNPYPKDTLLTSTEKRIDYYCKFFVRAKRFFLTGVSFHEVRDEYNGVKRI